MEDKKQIRPNGEASSLPQSNYQKEKPGEKNKQSLINFNDHDALFHIAKKNHRID